MNGRTKPIVPGAALLLVFLAWSGTAVAADYSETSTVDPTPDQPNSGDEVTATFKGPDTAKGKADVKAVKAAFDAAVAGSSDMKNKVVTAGNAHGRALEYDVKRDDPNIVGGQVERGGNKVEVDPGDIEKIGASLTGGTEADRAVIANCFLTETLAHETEHAKAATADDKSHADPGSDVKAKAKKGPAVDDENTVLQQLNAGKQRNQYAYEDWDGWLIDFAVNGTTVTMNFTGFKGAAGKADKFVGHAEHNVDPSILGSLPATVCTGVPGEPPCFDPVCGSGTQDPDCDSVGYGDDCPVVANPGQADRDHDGIGDACDCSWLDATNLPPPPVGSMTWSGKAGFVWGGIPVADSYPVYRGNLQMLHLGQYDHVCFQNSLHEYATDPSTPGTASGFYYLASARNGCGDSGLGTGRYGPRPLPFGGCP